MFLFAIDNEASVTAEAAFSQAAPDYKGKIIFSVTKPNDGFDHYQKLGEYVGADTSSAPTLILVNTDGDLTKYWYSHSEINVEGIKSFLDDYLSGKLKAFMKSEEIPASNDEPVKVFVGKNFQDEVYNNNKDIMVEFYAPWCGHCKELAPIYE